LGLTY